LRLLISSHAFHPSIGGLERAAQLLAEAFCQAGHQVDLLTATPSDDPAWDAAQPYRLWRRPSLWRRLRLLRQAAIVQANGASLESALPAVLLGRPLVITHQGYQLVSVDGLGWDAEGPTPLDPDASLAYYRSRLPRLAWWRQVLLLHLRRWVAHRAAANVAITAWVARRQPLPRQRVIANPVALAAAPDPQTLPWRERPVDLLFLGRLVQEKGLDVLLDALVLLRSSAGLRPQLWVVGDGPMRQAWQQRSERLGLQEQVRFLGSQRGTGLRHCLSQARIGVVPSVWEEPMGIVAVELLAAGLVPVVSAQGGLAECVGAAGVTVANGDPQALASQLRELLLLPASGEKLLAAASLQVAAFGPERVAEHYLQLFQDVSTHR
jgi:glycosyltransferase involved in cell wall biosynthesis